MILDKTRSIRAEGIIPWADSRSRWLGRCWRPFARVRIALDAPIGELTDEQQRILLYGNAVQKVTFRYTNMPGRTRTYTAACPGVIPSLEKRCAKSTSDAVRAELEKYMSNRPCPGCRGGRLPAGKPRGDGGGSATSPKWRPCPSRRPSLSSDLDPNSQERNTLPGKW